MDELKEIKEIIAEGYSSSGLEEAEVENGVLKIKFVSAIGNCDISKASSKVSSLPKECKFFDLYWFEHNGIKGHELSFAIQRVLRALVKSNFRIFKAFQRGAERIYLVLKKSSEEEIILKLDSPNSSCRSEAQVTADYYPYSVGELIKAHQI